MDTKHLWSPKQTREWSIILFLGTLCLYAARVALPICAVAAAKEYKWTKSESGAVLSCFFWGYAATQVLGGWLADRYGGDKVLALTTLVWSLITLFTPYLFWLAYQTPYPIPILVVLRVAMGISQGFHFPSMASLTSRRLISSERGRVFGLVMAGSHAGTVVCGSFGSVLLDYFGWEYVFYFIGCISLTWWVYLRYALWYLPQPPTRSPSGRSLLPLVSNTEITKGPNATQVPWLKLFSAVPFWAAFCAHYCGANAYFTLFSWLPSYFAENYPEAKGWVFNVVPNVAIVSVALTAPWIASNLISKGYTVTFTRRFMEGISLFGLGMCLFVVSTVKSYFAALFFLTLAMALRGFHHGGVAVNPQDFAPNHTGAVFGFMNTAAAIPGFVGVYVAGHILEFTHSWSYVFSITGVQCLVGMCVYIRFATGKQII